MLLNSLYKHPLPVCRDKEHEKKAHAYCKLHHIPVSIDKNWREALRAT